MSMDRFLILIFALLGATVIATEIGGAAFAEDKVRFSVAAVTGSYMDEFVAIEKGYHRDEGLSVEMIRAGGGIATQALIAGDLQFSTSAGSALTAMLRGAEIRVVYTNIDRPGYQVWSGRPEIKSLKDLIGKKVGVTSRGDTQELSVRLLLRKHGIDVNSVVYIPVGFGATRLAALQTGVVDAVPLGAGDFACLRRPGGFQSSVSAPTEFGRTFFARRDQRPGICAALPRADDSDPRQVHTTPTRVQRDRLRFDPAGIDAGRLGC
ncbi:MAG: ABC transporter substrate-binding protein [Deltaproteobacteria bacterium]|nr:MAG: ABC transporter substrate-binding protein [Deltaproteobacteria bacterium]